jgi:hypothetical protein
MSVRISGSRWKGLLDKFSDKVKNGEYSKIPYKDWKDIYTDKLFLIDVKTTEDCNVEITLINSNNLDCYDICYIIKNKGFYDFIRREVFDNIKVDKTLANCCAEAFKVAGSAAEITADSLNSISNVYDDVANTILNNTNYSTVTIPTFYCNSINKNNQCICNDNKEENDSMTTLNSKTEIVCNCSTAATSNLTDSYYNTKTDIDATKISTKAYGTKITELNIPSISSFDYYKYQGIWDSVTTKGDLEERFDKLEAELLKKEDKKENENTMKFNIDFGPVTSNVHMSMYGMAVKNKAGNYVSYDKGADRLVDVDTFNFDGSKYLYKIPVAFKDIKTGDVIIHNGAPCFVKSLPDPQVKSYSVIDVYEGEMKEILIPVNMFGFNYATKVVNLLEGAFGAAPASAENPFGNMLPLMLLSDGAKSEDMLPLMLMNASGTDIFSNPMMMYMMMKDRKDFDPMMMMLMMNQPQHTCHCKDKK